MAVVRAGFPVVAFAGEDAAGDDVRALPTLPHAAPMSGWPTAPAPPSRA
jgi:hypothetical protein